MLITLIYYLVMSNFRCVPLSIHFDSGNMITRPFILHLEWFWDGSGKMIIAASQLPVNEHGLPEHSDVEHSFQAYIVV